MQEDNKVIFLRDKHFYSKLSEMFYLDQDLAQVDLETKLTSPSGPCHVAGQDRVGVTQSGLDGMVGDYS